MCVMLMTASPMPANAMSRPALQARPAHREQQHREGERNGDAGDVQYIVEGVVSNWLLEHLRFLNQRYEHGSSSMSVPGS